MPRSHGGLELDLPTALEIIAALAQIEGSVGWTVGIGSGCDVFAALLPRKTYDQVYQSGPDVIIAGSAQPAGTAEAAVGGWQVNGRWPFASGCQHADWMFGLCVMSERGKPLADEAGAPLVRGFFLPARDWQIEDTWHVAGLKGTGSHHIALNDAVVPAANFFDLAGGVSCLPGPLYKAVPQLLPLMHGAICVGMAEGAMNDVIALANTAGNRRAPLCRCDSRKRSKASSAVLQPTSARRERFSKSGPRAIGAMRLQERCATRRSTQGMQTARWLATTCVRVGDVCFALGGGARSTRVRHCNGGCATFTLQRNTPLRTNDTTSARECCFWGCTKISMQSHHQTQLPLSAPRPRLKRDRGGTEDERECPSDPQQHTRVEDAAIRRVVGRPGDGSGVHS